MSAAANTAGRPRGIDPAALARLVRRVPEPLLRAAVLPPTRRRVVAEIFRRMPTQFRSTGATDAVIRWDVDAGEGSRVDTWFVVFEDGVCRTTRRPPETKPRTTFAVGALDFLKLATGSENPMQMFQSGRIRISGDLFFAAQVQAMFKIPV